MAKKKADKMDTIEKKKTKKTKPEIPSYKGIIGKLTKKAKEAVDALEAQIRKTLALPEAARLYLQGSYRRVTEDLGNGKTRSLDMWKLLCVGWSFADDSGLAHMDFDSEAGNVLFACQRVLSTYGTKVKVPKKGSVEAVIDEHADALAQLDQALRLPSPGKMLKLLCYALWAEKKTKDISLKDFLATRPEGFYKPPLRDQIAQLLNNLPQDRRTGYDERFATARQTKPFHVFEVTLKGYDAKNPLSHHLLKRVAAYPAVFQQWLKQYGMIDYLASAPVNQVMAIDDDDKREKLMRAALTVPPERGGVNLIIEFNKAQDKFAYKFLAVKSLQENIDPALSWPMQSAEFIAEEQARQDAKYRLSGQYQRVEEELAGTGEAIYKGQVIAPVPAPGRGYAVGHEQFKDLLAAMRSIDSATQATPAAKPPEPPKEKKARTPKEKKVPASKSEPPAVTEQQVEAAPPDLATPEPLATPPVEEVPSAPLEDTPVTFEELQASDVPWSRVQKFFIEQAGQLDEAQEVQVIADHLLTDYQQDTLVEMNLSVADVLNGRYGSDKEGEVNKMLADWNERLGAKVFSITEV